METLFKDFGNYLLSVNTDADKKVFIDGCDVNNHNKLSLIKMFRPEDKNENKIETIEENGNIKTIQRYSQIKEWVNVFGLKDDDDTYNELLKYLD
jgi:hypothetical protein